MKIKKIFFISLIPLLFVGLSVSSIFALKYTSGYSLDNIAYQINNYNIISKEFANGNYPYVKISTDNEELKNKQYTDLYKNTYYDLGNNGIRQYVDDVCVYSNSGFDDINVMLNLQSTYSIGTTQQEGGGYYIDNGLFYSYYSDDILGPRGYLDIRFGCESFIFISDYFADELVSRYHLEGETDPYKTLITNESYAKLNIKIGNTDHSFCINNILYSDKRTAPRVSYFNKYFALFYQRSGFFNDASICFEIDFKPSPYCITTELKKVSTLGYTVDKYDVEFYKYNKDSSKYYLDENITKQYASIDSSKDIYLYIAFVAILIFSTFLFYFLVEKKHVDQNYSFWVLLTMVLLLTIYSIVTTYLYTYPLFAVTPLYLIVVYCILKWEEIKNASKSIVFRTKR